MTPKPFYVSKTVIFNTIVTAVGILTLAQDIIPAEYVPWVILGIGSLNVVLRVWFTEVPIAK